MYGKRTLAALTALLLLLASVGPALGATVVDTGGPDVADHEEPGEDWSEKNATEAADEAYVTDGGDVVLVYQYDNDSDDSATGHVATNVSEGLAYLTLTDEDAPSNVTGDVTMVAGPNSVDANGTLSFPKPETLESMSLDVESAVDDTTAESSVDLSLRSSAEDESRTSALESMTTSGFVESSAEALTTNGSVTVVTGSDDATDRQHNYVLTERDGGYDMRVTESYEPLDPDAWDTPEAANETLQQQFCEFGQFVDCTVTVDSHDYSDGRLDISYTVSLDGVKSMLNSALPLALSGSDAVSNEQADRLADRLTNVTIDRVEADVSVSQGTKVVSWNVSMTGTDDLALAYADVLDIVAAMEAQATTTPSMSMTGPFGASPEEMADRLRTQVEAQRASGVSGTVDWNASLDATGDATEFDLSVTSETDDWGAYVDELRNRDGPVPANTDVTLTAETDGDRIVTETSMTVEKEGLFEADATEMERLTERVEDENAMEMIDAVRNAEFQRARMDLSLDGESTTLEAGMAADNATALTEPLSANLSSVETTYTDLDGRRTYVRLGGVVDGNASVEDVRELKLVDDSTTVSLSNEWDRSFPTMDTQYVEEYLGLAGNDGSADGLPTMMVAGGALAVTAGAGGLLLFNRLG